jgi:hypothetical protein
MTFLTALNYDCLMGRMVIISLHSTVDKISGKVGNNPYRYSVLVQRAEELVFAEAGGPVCKAPAGPAGTPPAEACLLTLKKRGE